MKNNITELVFILDRSGSMSGFEADTIGGFNATVNNALEATIARQNSHAFTEQEPHLDGVSRT